MLCLTLVRLLDLCYSKQLIAKGKLEHIPPILAFHLWIPVKSRIGYKILPPYIHLIHLSTSTCLFSLPFCLHTTAPSHYCIHTFLPSLSPLVCFFLPLCFSPLSLLFPLITLSSHSICLPLHEVVLSEVSSC